MNTEQSEPPVPQIRSSQTALALGSVIIAAFLMILLTALCYRILPIEVAKQLSEQIWEMIKNAAIVASGAGATGVVVRGLMLTHDRIKRNPKEPNPE